MPTQRVLTGDMRTVLAGLPERSVHLCVTSPPYFNLRDYQLPPSVWGGDAGCEHEWTDATVLDGRHADDSTAGAKQRSDPGSVDHRGEKPGAVCRRCHAWRGCLGAEPSVALFVAHLVECFRAVKRVLRDDGTCWVVLGDSYAGGGPSGASYQSRTTRERAGKGVDGAFRISRSLGERGLTYADKKPVPPPGLKSKDLCLVPERFRIAAQDDGWTVRSVIRWCKRSCMPESVTDRPTSAVEDIVVLAKGARYYWDTEAVRQPAIMTPQRRLTSARFGQSGVPGQPDHTGVKPTRHEPAQDAPNGGANLRNFWLLGPEPLADDHFAAYPTEIPRRAILAGTSEKGVCPACGAGWRRVVEREGGRTDRAPKAEALRLAGDWHGDNGSSTLSGAAGSAGWAEHGSRVETVGWSRSCTCDAGDPIPATILDPFLGSGRTLIAADRLGRDGIGVELNPAYVEMARRRIYDDCPLFASVAD